MKKRTKIIISLITCICVAVLTTAGVLLFRNKTENDNPVKDIIVSASNGEETGAASATVKEKGGAIYIGGGESHVMTGGEISNHVNTYGGAIYVANGGTFHMIGGKISGCEAIYGGAIYVEAGGTCIIDGGEISNNRSSSSAIFLEDKAKFRIGDDVVIKDNVMVSKYKINFYVDGLLIDTITSLEGVYALTEEDYPLSKENCCGYFFDKECTKAVASNLVSFSDKTMAKNGKINIYTKTATLGEFTFVDNGEGYTCMLSATGNYQEVVIPQTYEGKDITMFGGVSSSTNVLSVTLPASIQTIQAQSFQNLTELKSVNIPNSIKSIENKAFLNCSSLEGSITIPGKVTRIGAEAFNGCSSLNEVILENGITDIGSKAFFGCDSLTEIEIPSGVLNIGTFAFRDCANLETVYINKGLASLSTRVFAECSKLTTVVIPSSVTVLGEGVFEDCKSLKQVVLPETLEVINGKAFARCTNLTTLIIPESVMSIGPEIVTNNNKMSVIYCEAMSKPNGWDDSWHSNCPAEIIWGYLASNVVRIHVDDEFIEAQNVIGSYYYLEEENLPFSYEECCGYFLDPELTKTITDDTIEMQGEIVNIYTKTVSNLNNIVFELNSTTGFYELSAQYTGMSGTLVLPQEYNGVQTIIKESGFGNCRNLTNVYVHSAIDAIPQGSFSSCVLLDSFNFTDRVTSIGRNAFMGAKLTRLTLPESLETIGASAFQSVTALKSLFIPTNVSSIGEDAFSNIKTLTTIRVDEENEFYNSRNYCNALIETSTQKLLKGCDNTSFTLLDGLVTEIAANAFEDCEGLKNITIPDSVIKIGKEAFQNCINVTKINFNQNVATIEDYAFAYLKKLNYLTLPASVTFLGEDAFANCYKLVGAIMEGGIKMIPKYCFAYCYKLNHVVIPSTVTSIQENAFSNCEDLRSLYIPVTVTSIPSQPFYNCDPSLVLYCGASEKPSGYSNYFNYYGYDLPLTVHYNYTEEQYLEESGPSKINIYVDGEFMSSLNTYGTYYDLIEEELPLYYEECCGYFLDPELTIGTGGRVEMTDRNVNIYTKTANHNSKLSFFEMNEDPTGRLYVLGVGYISGELVIPQEYNDRKVHLVDEAFYGYSSITSVVLPDGTDNIVYGAFMRCSSLRKINILESITVINSSAFYHCTNFENFEFPTNLEIIGDKVFTNCISLTTVNIPATVTEIGVQAFEGCSGITSFNVDSANTVYSDADENALIHTATKGLMFGSQSTDLTSIQDLDRIENYAFAGQSMITSITIPASVTYVGWASFQNCIRLNTIRVDEANSIYDSRNSCNAVIEKATGKLIVGCNGTVFANLTGVTSIEISAFHGCTGLTRIVIPAGVTKIGIAAFANCTNLVSVIVPNTVTILDQNAFWKCTKLEAVYLPSSVAVIKDIMTGYCTFNGCSSLTLSVEVETKQEGWDYHWGYYDMEKRFKVNWGVSLEEFLLENPEADPTAATTSFAPENLQNENLASETTDYAVVSLQKKY